MDFVIPGLTRNPVKWTRNARHWIPALVPSGYSPV